MSTKPSDPGRFAVDGSDVNSTHISSPSSGLRDTGFTLNYVPPSSEANYLENIAYRWRQWLNDGDCQFRNLSASSTLTLAGDLTVGSQLLAFTDFTFTGNSSNNILTATAHGLQTGDGPVRVSNSGGALPSGLLAGTNYYVARIDANTFYLCPTRADALARASGSTGFEVTLNDNGTGTQTLLHQSGTTRITDTTMSRDALVGGTLTVGGGKIGGTAFSYPSTVFTANATFDTLIFDGAVVGTNHGLQTGSGPMRVSNSGGALPAPLAAGTDYWVIRSVNTKVKLATSFANAMAGIAIDLTTNGTGTQSIVSGTNAVVAGTLVVHGNVQVDGVIKGARRHHLSAYSFIGITAAPNYSPSDGFQVSNNVFRATLPLVEGQTLSEVSVLMNGETGGSLALKVWKTAQTNGSTQAADIQLGSTTNSATNTTGIVETVTVSGLSEVADSAAQIHYFVEIQGSGTTGIACIGLSYTVT